MSASNKDYDVFISFRGEDTRTKFASHLHQALEKENFQVFIDYHLNKGDDVANALAEAIRDSRISVVVLSQNYATSKWCLDELVEILKCRKEKGQVVIPVFYEVDPSDVRKQSGTYEKAFAKYETEVHQKDESNKFKVISAWRAALTEAANLSGWDSSIYRYESEVIRNIVKDVGEKLSLKYPNELKGLVEIDENRELFESLSKFSRIGIWGMGGTGKTTIARVMFAKHFQEYDSVCFMEKVNEEIEKFGLPSVRNKLLSELLKCHTTTFDSHDSFIQRRLQGVKVFIVLDDVDNDVHLEELCKGLDELGPDSRRIITTRNKHTVEGKVDAIYEVKGWEFPESLKLFSLTAFEQSHPKQGYEHLSKKVTKYATGIPLALKVLGSHFRSRDLEFWRSELSYFEKKEESLKDIQKVLKVSYDRLQEREQAIFLDIAFFFKGENKDFVIRVLDACDFGATSGMQILQDKALITISKDERIQMHDLLYKMGLEVVREANTDPGRRSRLRDIEEVCDVLKYNMGTHAVQGIALDLSQRVDLQLQAKAFYKLMNLRFLRLHVPLDKKMSGAISLPTDVKSFSDKLRFLEWNGYPLKSLPPSFCAELLVEIRLPHSNIEELWHGTQELVNLERIDLTECKQLRKLPDLSKVSQLKWLYLSGCESLCDIQPSTFSSDTLVTLQLERCKKLEKLISEKHLTSLQEINVYGCSILKEFSLSSNSIERLDLRTTRIEILHSSIGRLSNIVWLNLDDLKLKDIPDELSRLTSLKELSIANCNAVTKEKLQVLCSDLKSLRVLHLKGCRNLFGLPDSISCLSSLYELRLDGSSVMNLPASIKYLSKLEILSLESCRKLRGLPELPQHIKSFVVNNCVSLVTASTLKAFSEKMNGQEKYISFKNQIGLEGPSLKCAVNDAMLILMSAAFHNIIVRRFFWQTHSYNYNSAMVCLPGSKVPKQFIYRTSENASAVTVEISEHPFLRGFVFAVVVSPSSRMKKQDNGSVKIKCQCYSGGEKMAYAFTWWDDKSIIQLNSDHIYLWYDPFHSNIIFGLRHKRNLCLEFSVINEGGELNGSFSIKEGGVCPIYSSEFPRFLHEMRLGLRGDWIDFEMENKMQLHRFSYFRPSKTTSVQRSFQESDFEAPIPSAAAYYSTTSVQCRSFQESYIEVSIPSAATYCSTTSVPSMSFQESDFEAPIPSAATYYSTTSIPSMSTCHDNGQQKVKVDESSISSHMTDKDN